VARALPRRADDSNAWRSTSVDFSGAGGGLTDTRGVPTDFKTILKLTVPMSVQLGHRKMPLNEVLALAPGALVELPQRADDALVLHAANRPIGTGSAVKVGERFGLRVAKISPPRVRAQALFE